MAKRDEVVAVLSEMPLCDDCLSDASNVKPRQRVRAIGLELSVAGLATRDKGRCSKCLKGKIVTYLSGHSSAAREPRDSEQSTAEVTERPWYWEGSVQATVVSYLAYNGYRIQNVANTYTREAGKDIVAVAPDGTELWVSVKGYPERSRNVQARHWFSGAVFDLILYRGASAGASLALALPEGFSTYANLLPRVAWLKQLMPFHVYWVSADGRVRVE